MGGGRIRLGLEADAAGKYELHPSRDYELFDFVWQLLKEDEFDPRADGAVEDYDACIEHYAKVFDMGIRRGGTDARSIPEEAIMAVTNSHTRADPPSGNIQLDDTNSARQQALTKYLHKTAALDRDVMSFRSEDLGGPYKTLSRSEALGRLEKAEIPQGRTPDVPVVLVALPEGDFGRRFRVAEESVWGRLSKLAERLSRRYSWDEGQAAAFALCGEAYSDDGHTAAWFTPDVLRAGTRKGRYKGHTVHPYNRTVITMKVASWVPAELVKEVYSKKQKELNDGKRPSQPSLRCIEVFRFVLGHSVVKTVRRSENLARLVLRFDWRDLHGRWDKTYPPGHTWHYGDKGGRNFRRDFGIGQDNVLGAVAGGLLGIPGEPLTSAQRLKLLRERTKKQHGLPESLKKRYGPNVKIRRLN